MTTLEAYDHRFRLTELTPDEIIKHVENAAEHMAQCTSHGMRTTSADDDRVLLWLRDRLQLVYAALENPAAPVNARCAWCFRAGPQTDEAWSALPKMSLDDSAVHAQVCEHNPLVQAIRAATVQLEEIRGRALGIDDDLRDAIRALLKSEMADGDLRRALGELVR